MTEVPKKIVVDAKGNPVEVIIAWPDYKDIAERLGWDLDEQEIADLREAQADWKDGNHNAFVPLSQLK